MSVSILKQGAEGRLYIGEYKGEKCLIKERFVKKYRHPDLDAQITKQRMKAETKTANRCLEAGILAPKIFHMDLNERKIFMEYFDRAITVKEYILRTITIHDDGTAKRLLEQLCGRIGHIIGKLHANNIIHGDLTTSNIMINNKADAVMGRESYDVVIVDFGLSHYNQSAEDKGVDLYVLERALLSTHSEQTFLFSKILEAYRSELGDAEDEVMAKLEEVRARGRKRTMLG